MQHRPVRILTLKPDPENINVCHLSQSDLRRRLAGRVLSQRENACHIRGKAPDELRDFCYALPEATSSGTIGVGDVLAIGEHRFPITAIGALAQRNLDSLGHVTLVFDGADEPRLEGPPRTLWR